MGVNIVSLISWLQVCLHSGKNTESHEAFHCASGRKFPADPGRLCPWIFKTIFFISYLELPISIQRETAAAMPSHGE